MKTLAWHKEEVTKSKTYPISREGHSLTYLPSLQRYLLFGGIASKRINDVFLYNSAQNDWLH